MKRIMMACVVSLLGGAACVAPEDPAPGPAGEVAARVVADDGLGERLAGDPAALAPAAGGRPGGEARLCCVDWICPTTGEPYTGCFYSTPTPTAAKNTCNAVCDAACVNPYGTYCTDYNP